ncbi:MAG: AAA family ATPase [Caldilineaceae bacterium]
MILSIKKIFKQCINIFNQIKRVLGVPMSADYIHGLRTALQVTPENHTLRLLLAKALVEHERLAEAALEYQIVFDADKTNFEAALGLGKVLLTLNRPQEAKPIFERAIQLNEQHAEVHLFYAQALSACGDLGGAFVHQGLALKLDPTQKVKVSNSTSTEAAPSNVVTPERKRITFADVGGMENVKERIRLTIVYPILRPEIYKAYGKKAGGGLLLYGPPGCGKTYIARATAGEVNANFIYVGLNDVLDMWLGESERKLHAIFESARRQKPAVLFIDEVDALGNSRINLRASAGRNLVNQFLNELDGIQGDNSGLLILAATNAPWDIDSALRRPGRFDYSIFVEPPDTSARLAILRLHLRSKPHETANLEKIVELTDGFSGADIMAVVERAAEQAMNHALRTGEMRLINDEDMLKSVRLVKPSISEWLDVARNYVKYSNQSGFYDDVAEYLKHTAH